MDESQPLQMKIRNPYTGWTIAAMMLVCVFAAVLVVGHYSGATLGTISTDKSDNGLPTLMEFGATWCHFCQLEKPVLEELKQTSSTKLNIHSVDIDENKAEAARYRVGPIPLLVLLDASGKVLWREEGYLPKADLVANLRTNGVAL